MMKRLPSLFLALLLVAPAAQASAPEQSFQADYSVSLLGLRVATARFESTFRGDSFRVDGSVASSGIARLFDSTSGTTAVEGAIARDGVRPRSFSSAYTSGKKSSRTTISYAGDAVASVSNTPEPRRGANWVAVQQSHLRSVLDPLSATLIRTSDPAQVCGRTIRFFDGELRADLRLSPRGGPDANDRVICDARFVPVAGYRQGRRQIEYLRSESRITITFGKLGETGFYTPVDASVGTQIGTLRITANRITAR